jgi:threonine dehydratase
VPTPPERTSAETASRARSGLVPDPVARPVLCRVGGDSAVPAQRGGTGTAAVDPEAESVADLLAQLDSCDERLRAAGRAVREHARYCERNRLPVDRPVLGRLPDTVDHARARIAQERPLLAGSGPGDRSRQLSAGELVLRFGLATHAYARDALEWSSPAGTQAHAVQFFDLAVQRSPVSADARHGGASAREVERQTCVLLGLPDTYTVSATSSGQSAYALVEAVLLRERLLPGDIVLAAPTAHLDAVDQLAALPFIRTIPVGGHTIDDLLSAVVRYRPRCLLLAQLGCTAHQHVVDVPVLVRRLAAVAAPMTVVVDGTALPAALPGGLFGEAAARGVELIYYESASTHLQLGLDNATVGIVAHPVGLGGAFARVRAATGTVLHRHGADLFPHYTADVHRGRMLRIGRNAVELATALAANPVLADLGVVCHPCLPDHPDSRLARSLPHAGGCVTFWFHDADRNRRTELEGVCAHVLEDARVLGAQLTRGAGFGFSVPRLAVTLAADAADPVPGDGSGYLRLSAGDRGGELHRLVDAVASTLTDPVARALAD